MIDPFEQFLSGNLSALHAAAAEPDWADVRRRARKLSRHRRARSLAAGLACAVVAVAAATPALGLRGQIVQLFGGGEPAPAPVVEDFSQIDVAAPEGMATGVIAGEARDVLEVPLSTGKNAVVWVAPTKSGGFCRFTSTEGRGSMGGGGCDRDRSLPFAPGMSIPGPVSPQGEIEAPPVIFHGDTLIHGATTLEIRFEDGESATAPITWVSSPIDAGFFVYEVPQAHWAQGHRASLLILKDASDHELARDSEAARVFGDAVAAMASSGAKIARENAADKKR
jgi:hypothetical protein